MQTDLIDNVAQAICDDQVLREAVRLGQLWAELSEANRSEYRAIARAAIFATLRQAGAQTWGEFTPEDVWVTPAMVEEGVIELRDWHFGESLAEIVTNVFIAMIVARKNEVASAPT